MYELWGISYLGSSEGGSSGPAPVVDVQAGTYSQTSVSPDGVNLTLSFSNTGLVSVVGGSGPAYSWLTNGVASEYSIYFQLNSGSLDSGTVNTWLNLATSHSWNITVTESPAEQSATATISIRRDSDGLVLDSADITMSAVTESSGSGETGGTGDFGGGGGTGGGHLP